MGVSGEDGDSAFIVPLDDTLSSTEVVAPDGILGEGFGGSVAITDESFAVGAWLADDETALNATGEIPASVYLFNSEGLLH